jgi:hypothetical protein
MSSTTLYLGDVARVQGLNMTVISGRKLDIVEAPTSDQNAANKAYVDLKAKEVQDALNLVTAGSDVTFDTLLELKTLSDNIRDTGATNLYAAISTEEARATAAELVLRTDLATEDARATAAELVLRTDLATEDARATAAELVLRTDLATEDARATAAELVLRTDLATEDARATAAELVLRTDLATEDARATAAELVLRTDLATEDARATAAEFRLQTMNVLSSTTMLYVPTVYADSSSLPTPLERCSYTVNTNPANFDGWRMKNAVTGNKFNFYVPATGLKVGDVKAMYLEACTPSVVSMPFLTFYTVKKGDAGEGSWYRSKATYIRNDADVLVAGSKYNMVANLKSISNVHTSNYFTQHNLILDTFSSRNVANMGDSDDILFFAISSDSSSSAGNMECIISKFKVQLATGIHEFVFSNTHVFADYMKRKQSQLWNSLYGSSSSDDPFINDFQIPARTYA